MLEEREHVVCKRTVHWGGLWTLVCLPSVAFAADGLNAGDTAWVLMATALVLFMMIPGLAMFYAGLVRRRNVLSLYMQCFALTAIISVLWTIYGYSLAFDTTGMQAGAGGLAAFIGGSSRFFLSGVSPDTLRGTIPEALFFVFQMTFAIITPGLIIGAFAERMKFSAILLFCALWVTFAYLPICHMVWGGAGAFFADMGVFDFAGGIVVHITAGVSALVAAIMVGKRHGYPETPMPPHNLTMALTGTGMLWVGWFGFNGGSALAANGQASMAVVVTQISPCVAAITWSAIEWLKVGKPSALGLATGAIAGLAAITPASGYIGPVGALVIGFVSSALAYFAVTVLKRKFGYDDALDVVGVHGVGGFVGTILVGIFASSAFGGSVQDLDIGKQLGIQAFAAVTTAVYCGIVSFVLLKIVDGLVGLRVDEETEYAGLDLGEHGEVGYDL
jgi:ammonium transporter, Amt family